MITQMKKLLPGLFIYVCMFSITIVTLSSCHTSGDDFPDPPNNFTWTYDNQSYAAKFFAVYVSSITSSGSVISGNMGTDLNTPAIGLRITISSLAPGTYDLNAFLIPFYIQRILAI
jgi:hypothetical protein